VRDKFYQALFTDAVIARQEVDGVAEKYAHVAARADQDGLGENETQFIASRTSFYMASVSESGWPYVQHRGGPAGFVKIIDDRQIGFADYRGNKQFITAGNTDTDDRVSLFFMDYPRKGRLKMLARARFLDPKPNPRLADQLAQDGAPAPERLVILDVEGFDWNCPKYITPRFDEHEMAQIIGPRVTEMTTYIAQLEAKLTALDPTWKDTK
jgi:predicted pyridoxine 5'-phosphate oxidase superfamily flavin-nucleotide-binding protein